MIAKLVSRAPTRHRCNRDSGRSPRSVRDRSDQRQCRLSLGASCSTRASLRRYHDRLHRRGISRRIDGAPADAQLFERSCGHCGDGRARCSEGARSQKINDQLGDRVYVPCERVVKDRQTIAEQHVRISPTRAERSPLVDNGDLIDVIGRWSPGQHLVTVLSRVASAPFRCGASGAALNFRRRGAIHKGPGLCASHVAELSRFMIDKPPPDLSRFPHWRRCRGSSTKLNVSVGDHVATGCAPSPSWRR